MCGRGALKAKELSGRRCAILKTYRLINPGNVVSCIKNSSSENRLWIERSTVKFWKTLWRTIGESDRIWGEWRNGFFTKLSSIVRFPLKITWYRYRTRSLRQISHQQIFPKWICRSIVRFNNVVEIQRESKKVLDPLTESDHQVGFPKW